ncbi:MAG: HYR domain-containing protein [Cyclobacteriaceae bacterium]|nr:HYR domain-containing protein [Cyclobacteriaceae bacterium]
MTLRYNGGLAVAITVSDLGGIVYTNILVNPGTQFSFSGSNPIDKFVGPNLTVTVNALLNATIGTNCANNVQVGDTFGSFTVMAISSLIGGPMCCPLSQLDTTPPVITGCPANINQPAVGCSATATWTEPTATDFCTVQSFVRTHAPGSTFPVEATAVVYTAKDPAGNTSTCTFTVTVTDTTPPVISGCPANINVSAAANCKAFASWTAPTALDNCSVQSFTSTHAPGSEFNLGTTTVTYTAKDPTGNTSTCTFTVTVIDTTPPVISGCPANINISAAANCKAFASWTAPTALDNCAVQSFTSSHASGSEFNLGTTTVTYTALDAAGNSSTCTFTVTVIDTTPPVISGCPANIIVSAAANCKAFASWTAPTALDNCAVQSFTSTHAAGSEFNLGTTTVTYTALDAAGNSSTCTFTVTVIDTTPPVISGCPANINVSAAANCKAFASWTAPTASDNCAVQSFTSTHASGSEFNLGTTTVTYTASDAAGNLSTCTFTVTVTDTTPPVISGCPANINVSAAANCKAFASWTAPTASDNCAVQSFTSTHASGSEFNLGTTTVTYTASDAAGNLSTCTFTVTVIDTTPPVISGCPANINVSATANCKAFASWTAPTALDNCSVQSFTSTHAPGSEFDTGITTVTYTAIDLSGNRTVCSFDVIVENNETIQLTGCPSDVQVYADETDEAEVTWVEPVFSIQCGTLTVEQTASPGTRFPVGATRVAYKATDPLNRTASCMFVVTVVQRDIDVKVSQLVSPDGDGFNDVWKIFDIENYPDNEVLIVDRWGSEVFKTTGYNAIDRVWDGTKNGALLPTGTYFYRLRIQYGRRSIRKEGFIELVR